MTSILAGAAANDRRLFLIAAELSYTWASTDLETPVEHFIAIEKAPSLTKEALSMGWLEGDLVNDDYAFGLHGKLRLTDVGRGAVLHFRRSFR